MFCMHVCALLTDAAHLLCVVKGGGGFTPFFIFLNLPLYSVIKGNTERDNDKRRALIERRGGGQARRERLMIC